MAKTLTAEPRAVVNRCVKGTRRRPLLPFPLSYFVPRATLSTKCGALSFLKLIWAAIFMVFQIKQVALTCDLNRLEAAVRSLTPVRGD